MSHKRDRSTRSRESRRGPSSCFIRLTTTTRRRRLKDPGSCSPPRASRRASGSRRAAVTLAPSTPRRPNTVRECSTSSVPPCTRSRGRLLRSKGGDDLADMDKVFELMLEDPPHHFAGRPAPSHDDMIERCVRGLHEREPLKHDAMNSLERCEWIGRPPLETRQKTRLGDHHMLEGLADAPCRVVGLSFELLRGDVANERDERGARRFELMEEVPKLVLLQGADVLGHDAIGRHVAHHEGIGVEVLPMLDRDAARVEQLDVRAKRSARVRYRLVAALP